MYISIEVHEEIQVGLEEGYAFYIGIDQLIYPFVTQGWIQLTSLIDEHELSSFGKLLSRLQRGEASCLAIAQHRHWTLLTDDKAARTEAAKLSVRVSGTWAP